MNLPNRLTVGRIAAMPVFALCASLAARTHGRGWYAAAGLLFALAALTDLLDGRLARELGQVTKFGKFADPLADKILTTAAFLYMQKEGVCAPAVLLCILLREFSVSGLRMLAASSGGQEIIAANLWGKVKTVLQMITILFFYFGSAIVPLSSAVHTLSNMLCWACALATLASGVIYFMENLGFLVED